MSEPFVGEIMMFGGNFAPRNWAFCDGQLLAVAQNDALFSLLGTFYGGDGRTTFGLPDLRGRVPIHQGSGPGLSSRNIGHKSGSETETLNANHLPTHKHTLNTSNSRATQKTPGGAVIAHKTRGDMYYANFNNALVSTSMGTALTNTGGSGSHPNVQPSLGIHYCIALAGIYPSRN